MISSLETERESRPLELAVVIPTYNERENVSPMIDGLETSLKGIEWEAVFVDDNSPDGTAEQVREIALTNRRIRIIERIGRRGLSSACIEGILATPAPYIAVMDGDLQHEEGALVRMIETMKAGNLDLVVASRKILGGSIGELSRRRIWLNTLGSRISRLVCRCNVSDPMSGFFLVSRNYFRLVVHRLTGKGFKILVDLLASSPEAVRLREVPYQFRNRQRGESKLDLNVELEYLYLVVDKIAGRIVPTRFVLFSLVGSFGLLVHFAVLALFYYRLKIDFILSQALATVAAMTGNFVTNNLVTFRDRRLRGWRFLLGLITFYLACSLGALANVSFAAFLQRSHIAWYAAGISGMVISSVWNYGANTVVTWRRNLRPPE